MIGKYIDGAPDSEARAEEAFRRALELNPRLSVAHKFYANLEADIGQAQRGARAPAGRGQPSRQRSGAVRGARPRLPLLRTLRAVDRRARRGAPARPERPHEPRADAADDGRHRAAPGRRAAAGRRRRRRRDPGHRPRPGRASRRGAPGAARDAPGVAHSGLSVVDRVPDGLARSPRRGHARRHVRAQRA